MSRYDQFLRGDKMSRLVEVKFSLTGMIRGDKQTDAFVSYCPALDLYSAGRTRPEAKRALQSAVDMYVRICYDRNILGNVLHSRGFEASKEVEATGADHSTDFIEVTESIQGEQYDDVFPIDVPLHLIANQQAQRASVPCLQ